MAQELVHQNPLPINTSQLIALRHWHCVLRDNALRCYGVAPSDTLAFDSTALVLVAAAIVASLIQAWPPPASIGSLHCAWREGPQGSLACCLTRVRLSAKTCFAVSVGTPGFLNGLDRFASSAAGFTDHSSLGRCSRLTGQVAIHGVVPSDPPLRFGRFPELEFK